MSNASLAVEERNLTPDEVETLDKRRQRGLTYLVISGQFGIVSVVLLLWVGQDLTYSPGWARPTFYYLCVALLTSIVTGLVGVYLRRGNPEF
jgi:hypothetical protein